MKTELISFYTDIDNRTYYSDHAKRLQENCQTLNIPIDIIKLESQGDYRLNCLAKPKFILEMMQKKQKPVVWMDVDSIIHEELTVFDTVETYDIGFAAVHNNIKASPIYLNYNPLVLEFIQNWIDDCDTIVNNNIPVFDHEVLIGMTLQKYHNKMKIFAVGIAYAIWPGIPVNLEESPKITMGIADGDSKKQNLQNMHMFTEDQINFQLVGNKYNQ